MMALEHYFSRKWDPAATDSSICLENPNDCFDCNICLDLAHEPVVTLCGHLYCWPCIYKWLDTQRTSNDSYDHPQCPVCKAPVSRATLVPLYGRGQTLGGSSPESRLPSSKFVSVPPRPGAFPSETLLSPHLRQAFHDRNLYQAHHHPDGRYAYQEETSALPFPGPGGTMFGEMVYARMFGNLMDSYQLRGMSTSARARRLEMQAEKSLNRVSIFLFLCFLLCLIVF